MTRQMRQTHQHRDPAEGGRWDCKGCREARNAELAQVEQAAQDVRTRKTAGETVACVDCGQPVLIGTTRRCQSCLDRID